jgi:hypothetical protein
MSDFCLLNEARPKARKQHRCIWCGQPINKGDVYLFQAITWDGSIQNQHWHFECADAQQAEARETGEPEFMPHENERPASPSVAQERQEGEM